MVIDSGLHCLALVAQLHQVAVDPAALQHRFGQGTAERPVEELLRAARALGFRAKHLPACELAGLRRTLPAIIPARDGSFCVLAAMSAEQSGATRYLVQQAGAGRPEAMDQEQFEALWSGEAILLTPRRLLLPAGARSFNLHWFLPSLARYRKLFIEVVVASFFLQLFALVTPLFFQVVMDKVLVHQGFTTLNVLAVWLCGGGRLRSGDWRPAQLPVQPHQQPGGCGTGGAPVSRTWPACRWPTSRPARWGRRWPGCGSWTPSAISSPVRPSPC